MAAIQFKLVIDSAAAMARFAGREEPIDDRKWFAAPDALAARNAYLKYGRGYHPVVLNLVDCFSYALAKSRNEPLLFKGDHFAKTDVIAAWRPQNVAASSKTCRPRLGEPARQ